MGECGCMISNPTYRLPIHETACYAIELYQGCKYCSAAPGIVVRCIEKSSVYWEYVQEAPLFPLAKVDDIQEGAIKCGADPDEFRKIVVADLGGTRVDDSIIDEDLAEIIADDLWESGILRPPEVIRYRDNDIPQG
jgi:hypothetical protein